MNEAELGARLLEIAEKRAAAVGRRLGEGAEVDLQGMTAHAAKRLVSIPDPAKRTKEIRQAEIDIERLIDLAIEGARALPDYPDDLLGERSYFPAKLRFCPCRPFC